MPIIKNYVSHFFSMRVRGTWKNLGPSTIIFFSIFLHEQLWCTISVHTWKYTYLISNISKCYCVVILLYICHYCIAYAANQCNKLAAPIACVSKISQWPSVVITIIYEKLLIPRTPRRYEILSSVSTHDQFRKLRCFVKNIHFYRSWSNFTNRFSNNWYAFPQSLNKIVCLRLILFKVKVRLLYPGLMGGYNSFSSLFSLSSSKIQSFW